MLLKKPVVGALLLASAAGGPYVLYETDAGQAARQTAGWLSSDNSQAPALGSTTQDLWNFNLGTPPVEQLQAPAPNPTLTGPVVHDLREVLRFDIAPHWVPQRFARVSTVLADLHFDGLRVPLVSGTEVGDLAGTLTYYFDRYQRLQRIKVHALTGDPSRVVQTLQGFYQLQQEPALGGGLYLIRWNGQPTSVLHIAPAPIIYSTAEHSRYSIFLELNQPNIPYGLSDEARQFMNQGHASQRW